MLGASATLSDGYGTRAFCDRYPGTSMIHRKSAGKSTARRKHDSGIRQRLKEWGLARQDAVPVPILLDALRAASRAGVGVKTRLASDSFAEKKPSLPIV